MNDKIDKYEIERLELHGKPMVKVYNNNSKKAWNRQVHFWSFRTVESREEYIENFKKNVQTRLDEKAKRKADKKAFMNPAKAGDILESSWGYDQTNVDYYQVTKVLGKMIEMRKIGGEHVEGSGQSHGMSDEVRPSKGSFIEKEKPMRKLVKGENGSNGYFVTIASYANAYLINENKKTYRSWYA